MSRATWPARELLGGHHHRVDVPSMPELLAMTTRRRGRDLLELDSLLKRPLCPLDDPSVQEDRCDKGAHQLYLRTERNTHVIPN